MASPAAAITAQPAALAALPPGLVEQALALSKQAAQAVASPQARVVVTAGAPDSRLKLAPCAAATASLAPGVAAWGASRVNLRCTQGASWSVQLPVKVQVFAPAVVARMALASGTALAADLLTMAEVDWAAHAAAPSANQRQPGAVALFNATADLAARQLARPLQPGAPVRSADLQTRQWFGAGAVVSVVAVGNGFSVVAEGQALSPGLEGQLVRVRTEGGRVVAGQATGERQVEVRL